MFSSFSSFQNPFVLPRFLGGNPGSTINVKPVEVHDVESQPEKRARTLKHLLKLNHANHSIIYHDLHFHNHMPHLLGSSYILGAESAHLNAIYDSEHGELEPWKDSPNEVSTYDWRDYLGDPRYQRAYVDFFEDELVLHGYDWKRVVAKYLLEGKQPLVNNLIGGLGHPLIHLGYAYEISSREVAMEALGLATTQYNFLHKYIDELSYSKIPSPASAYSATPSPLDILYRVRDDKRFDTGSDSIDSIFKNHENALLEHWNAWQLPEPRKQFEDSQYAATALLTATHGKHGRKDYDFFLVHILTTSHAVRILLPFIPAKFHVSMVRQWWLLTLAVYIMQQRPEINVQSISDYDLKGRGWDWVKKHALEGKWALDAHFVKGLRAMKVAAETWGDGQEYYLKAAVKMVDEFAGWGFGLVRAEGIERRGSASAFTSDV